MTDETWMGIDLGTTYSCMAYMKPTGEVEIVRNEEGEETTPSVVQYDGDDVVVGIAALNTAPSLPDKTIAMIKRYMGKGSDSAINIDGVDYLPEQISSEIVKKLLNDFEGSIGFRPQNVVISHPAYFGSAEREATRRAAELAGVKNIKLIEEPVAAAIAYAKANTSLSAEPVNSPKTIFVYDLGGGTFDVTILRYTDSTYKVVAMDGKRILGGKDWDKALSEIMIQEMNLTDLDDGDKAFLAIKAEEQKRILSNKSTSKAAFGKEKCEITREDFERKTKGMLNETLEICDRVFKGANEKTNGEIKSMDDIDEIILVGGSSRMPQVKTALEKKYHKSVKFFDPDLCVAKGAAIYGATSKNIEIGTVLSRTFGTMARTNGRTMISNIIYKNSDLPASAKRVFYPIVDNQESIDVRVFENGVLKSDPNSSNTEVEDCIEVGHFPIELAPNTKTTDEIWIEFKTSDEGLLHVTVNRHGMPDFEGDLVIGAMLSSQPMPGQDSDSGKSRLAPEW